MFLCIAFLLTACTAFAQQGFDPARLAAWRDDLAARDTKALLIARDGRTVFEWYAEDFNAARTHYSASLAKALVGGMSLLLATADGRIAADDPAAKYIAAWRDDPRKSKILIRHLATHTSGIEDAEQDSIPHMQLPGWKGVFWRRDPDPFTPSLRDAPVLFEPGKSWAYSNPGMAALAYAVTASLRGAPQSDIRALLKERVFDPLGVPEQEWQIGYGRAYEVDGLRLYANWGGGGFSARATAAVGELMMRQGGWRGRQLLDARRVREALRDSGMPKPDRAKEQYAPGSGLGWYHNLDGVWPAVPRDAFGGAGAGHQLLLVVPSLRLVVVRNGGVLEKPATPHSFWNGAYRHVFARLMEALADPPYPRSSVIRGVEFAPVDSIRRDSDGSDNWPITWGDDGHLYTSYGDGWGFAPRTEKKLSLGWARIEGTPDAFRGVNIRSESGEREGDGRAGPKASGLLMVDGVLYAWVRNTGNAQMIWSGDRGVTWQWGFRFEQSFGSPAFLNFGRNYAGARDEFVYTYSQDGPSAYEQDDGVALARAPKSRLREKEAWEFFARLDDNGRPVWTRDIAQRGQVFRFPGYCERVDAVYHPGLKRYLLAVGYNHAGGWGLFDAPEPWGPWSVAFHTHLWDVPGTHGYRLPSKWIGAGGGMALIYSGTEREDAFCVRAMRLNVAR